MADVKPKVPFKAPEKLLEKKFVLTTEKEEKLRTILRNSGADSRSQQVAMREIKELLEG